MVDRPDHLFVYGSLRREAAHPMHRVVAGHARHAGLAWFAGEMFDLGSYPGAIPAGSPESKVMGEVYEILRDQPLLNLLDRYEGCTALDTPEDTRDETTGDAPEGLFRREMHPVHLLEGRVVQAWIFLYNRPTAGLKRIPGGDYLEWMRLRTMTRFTLLPEDAET